MASITAAFLGVAHIHTPGFIKTIIKRSDAGEVRLKSVWDHDSERGQRRAKELDAAFVASLDEILADDEVTAVVICAETNRHRDVAIAAAKAGKDIFCEKPLGLGADDAQAIADAIEKAGVRFQTGFFHRSSPVYQFIKREVEAGHLGKLTRAHYTNCHGAVLGGWFDTEWRWLTDAKVAGGGALLDMGAHPLDLAIGTFSKTEGEIVEAKGVLGNRVGHYGPEIDEYGIGILSFESGLQVVFEASWDDPGLLRSPVAIFGTEGQILVKDDGVYYQSQHVEGADGKTPVAADQLPAGAPHAFEIFWDTLLGRPTPVPPVSVREAALGSTVMEKVYKSAGRSTTTGL